MSKSVPDEYKDAESKLNTQQRAAYDTILDVVLCKKQISFFIDGPGGTSKTFLYYALYAKLWLLSKIVLPTTTSGIAASNIPTGRTAHSRFKIPITDDGGGTCSISKQSSLAALIQDTSLIIWDKASMAKRQDVECLDSLLQDICNNSALFGEKVVVFEGDFSQVLPVMPYRTEDKTVQSSLVNSYIWPKLVKFTFVQNMRARADSEFSAFLLRVGNGALQALSHQDIILPDIMVYCNFIADSDFSHMIGSNFPEMNADNFASDIFRDRAILTDGRSLHTADSIYILITNNRSKWQEGSIP